MRERLIHSIQKQVEVDEPEAVAAPAALRESRPTLGRDDPTTDAVVDTMTEEELLRGLERLSPEEPSSKSEGGPPGRAGTEPAVKHLGQQRDTTLRRSWS